MGTFLFDSTVFGPVKSRRLGQSLGINLLPVNSKVCSFNCVYCECGWTHEPGSKTSKLLPRENILEMLENRLAEIMNKSGKLDAITFAGNGEPTLHPGFEQIIDGTRDLRDSYFPGVPVVVLSNATTLGSESVFRALQKVERNILKLDGGTPAAIKRLNMPCGAFDFDAVIQNLKRFHGKLQIQTMFVRGMIDGKPFDNTLEEELSSWIAILKDINPEKVLIYSIDRDTPLNSLEKVQTPVLEKIRDFGLQQGVPVEIY